MSTAAEILARITATMPKMETMRRAFELQQASIFGTACTKLVGREVCAKRARKLRRLGYIVVKCGKTKTGKTRYKWRKTFNIKLTDLYVTGENVDD